MSIWSRIAEAISSFGESVAGFLASAAARPVGDPEQTVAFTIGMIALGAKMAKADGIVTGDEIAAFKQVFHIPPGEIGHVARVFNLAKQDVAGYESYARQLARLFTTKPQMLETILDSLFHIAKADDALHERELEYLSRVAAIFGFDQQGFARIKSRHVLSVNGGPWAVLGIEPSATDETVRKRYRKLVFDNHPDRQIAAGVPEEMVEIATDRLAAINAAYDTIALERGL